MEAEEAEAQGLSRRIEQLYNRLHPNDNLRTIPGVGESTAPVFLAAAGDPHRFRSQPLLIRQVSCLGQSSHRKLRAKG